MNLEQRQQVSEQVSQALSKWSRRGLLLRGTAGIALGGVAFQAACTPKTSIPAAYGHLGADYPVVDKLVRTLIPFEHQPRLAQPEVVPVLANINTVFGDLPSPVRSDLSQGLALFNYAAIVLGFYGKPFTRLSSKQAEAYARRWEQGNKTQQALMFALKQIVYISYWREPTTWAAIDYEGPTTRKYGIASLGSAPLPEAG